MPLDVSAIGEHDRWVMGPACRRCLRRPFAIPILAVGLVTFVLAACAVGRPPSSSSPSASTSLTRLSGVVVDADGQPIGGVDVLARPRNGGAAPQLRATTDADGRFDFGERLSSGPWRAAIAIGSAEVSPVEVDIRTGQAVTITIVMEGP